jgi:hypothetical protein
VLTATCSTLWLVVAVEQYEALPTESQALIANVVAQLEQDPDGHSAASPGHSAHRAITVGDQAEHLVVRTVVVDQGVLIITRIVS